MVSSWRACKSWSGILRAVCSVRGSDAIKGAQALACYRRCSRSIKANFTFHTLRPAACAIDLPPHAGRRPELVDSQGRGKGQARRRGERPQRPAQPWALTGGELPLLARIEPVV